jgi:hypothetical protein
LLTPVARKRQGEYKMNVIAKAGDPQD